MSFTCGLVGLPNAGKSTIFNALTGAGAAVAPFPFSTLAPQRGRAAVPDPRLERLAELLRPAKVTPATLEVLDLAGLVEGAHRGEGLGNQFLAAIREADALLHVVRCFPEAGQASLDPVQDAAVVATELLLADLELVERRLERLARQARIDPQAPARELALARELKEALERGQALRRLDLRGEAQTLVRGWGYLTAKPFLYIANVRREDPDTPAVLARLEAVARADGAPVIGIDGKLEGELLELPPSEQAEFRRALGLEESALARLERAGYELLGLLTFYTVVGPELRAWSLPRGATALEAAAKIHSDMARGFIRAEVVPFEAFAATPSWATLRERGLLRLEGRDYPVRDGDILTVRFAA
ncbi:MAG: redox-regulated ATPase YchF [Candidatus Rokubacteria bacterium]|nr:redox-regulated ATPase YchF [Candidatus Rokubacteria bacterium]